MAIQAGSTVAGGGTAEISGGQIAVIATTSVGLRRNATFTQRVTPVIYVGAGFITYVLHNFTVPDPASYRIIISGLATGSSQNTQVQGRVLVDGVIDLGGPLQAYGVANGVFSLNGTIPFFFAAGAHTAEIQYQLPAGPGTFTATVGGVFTYTED